MNDKLQKWEISLIAAIVATLLFCAVTPRFDLRWWTTAFAPLCDELLSMDLGGEEIILRSKLWELLSQLF